jgi:spore coat polysaccharide biosynthesis predicted glycosyltransferase SpsG
MVIVRCDGGAALGMGHVSRCLALAGALRQEHAGAVRFAMRDPGSAGVEIVRANGYDVAPIVSPRTGDYGAELLALALSCDATALVVDVRDALSRASLDTLRAAGVRVVVVDDGSDRRLASDLAFYPPVPQVEELDWSTYGGRRFTGWEWVLLKREFAATIDRTGGAAATADSSPAIDVLVTMGGSDPAGMTEFTVEALELLPMPLAVLVVVGPAFARALALADPIARSKHAIRIAHAPSSMASLMASSRIAVASFGVSAYELAACGVPAVHLCLTPDHARSASAFAREDIALTAGVFADLQPRNVSDAAARLIGSARRRKRMAARARALVDGRGASRIAALVHALL